MFFCFILFFVSNKLFEGDNIYIYATGGRNKKDGYSIHRAIH